MELKGLRGLTGFRSLKVWTLGASLAIAFSIFGTACDRQISSTRAPETAVAIENTELNQAPLPQRQFVKSLLGQIKNHDTLEISPVDDKQIYADLTVLLSVKDTLKARALIEAGGGQVLYDPNLDRGIQISFLIASLPPEKILDDAFIKSLGVKAMQIDHPDLRVIKPLEASAFDGDVGNLFVPRADVQIPQLEARFPGKTLGDGVTVAVIDTGIDASHPVFQDRVIYWADDTQETKTAVREMNVTAGMVQVEGGPALELPEKIKSQERVLVARLDEAAMRTQLSGDDKNKGATGLDINKNGRRDDVFAVVLSLDFSFGFLFGLRRHQWRWKIQLGC